MKKLVALLSVVFLVGIVGFPQQEPPAGRVVVEFWHAFRGALGDVL